MTTTVDPPAASRRRSPLPSATSPPQTPAQRLRHRFAACRVSFTWLGVRKTLSSEQRSQAAESFGAEGQYLSAAKKLLDTRHEAFGRVTAVRSRTVSFWKAMSLPYPEPGVRLIKQEDIEAFDRQLSTFRQELSDAVANLDVHYDDLRAAARDRLGSLYNEADYPATLTGLFAVEWDFPSTEPPEYLRLNPQLYEQERQRIAARFDEAVRLTEEAFTAEFAKLVGHLTERLTPGVDGERKVFRDTAVTNLTEFFERFRSLNVRSSAELDGLVERARQVVGGVDPTTVRDSDHLRRQITERLADVRSGLDDLLVDQPRRRVLRPSAGMQPVAKEVPS